MTKNINLRKQIKELIDSDRSELPKKPIARIPTLKTASSDNNLRIKDLRLLLQEDIKKNAEKPQINPFTRDISHLQDKKSPTSISLPILPMDIHVLKKMKSAELYNFHTPNRCQREDCLDAAFLIGRKGSLEQTDTIDRLLMGHPTGRQEIKELCTWFSSMLETHQNSDIDTIMVIYDVCAKELTRQVAVQCVERGELLQILFMHQPDILKRKIEELNKDIQRIKAQHLVEIGHFREKIRKGMKDLVEKNFLIKKILNSDKSEKRKVVDELNKLKVRYNEFVRKFNEQEKVWKTKHINLLVKLRESFSGKNNSSQGGKLGVSSSEGFSANFDVRTIINQEIMEFEVNLSKLEVPFEVPVETQEVDTDKLLKTFEKELQDEKEENQADEGGTQEFLPEPDPDMQNTLEKLQELPETQETLATTVDKETATEIQSFNISTEQSTVILPSRLQNFEIIQESSIEISPTDYLQPEDLPPEPLPSETLPKKLKSKKTLSKDPKKLHSESKPLVSDLQKPEKKDEEDKNAENLLLAPKSARKSKKKPTKQPKKPLEKPKKDFDLQQVVDSLKIQLQEKTETLNDLLSNKSSASAVETQKQLENKTLSRESKIFSRESISPTQNYSTPRGSNSLLSPYLPVSELSPRDSVFQVVDTDPDLDTQLVEELIPVGCDVYSWKSGYSSGFEKGKKEGFKEGEILGAEEKELESGFRERIEEEKEESEENEEKDEGMGSPNRMLNKAVSLRTEMFRKRVKDITKIIQFQFTRPGTQKKQHPVYSLISKFMLRSKESVMSSCTLSRKMVNKIIGATLMNCLSKIRTGDHIESLVEQVYDDFYQKYGLKAVSEKRFIELVSSLFTYTSFKRVTMFIKFLGCGGKASLKSYSRLSFIYYLGALSSMINLKVGVMVAFDEIADKQMFPTLRGLECAKDKLEWIISKDELNNALSLIQSKSEADTKGVNPTGLIELEYVLELIIDHYEEYQQRIESGLITVCTAFGVESFLESFEFLMIVRHVSADRLDYFEDEAKSEGAKKVNFLGLVKFVESREMLSLADVSSKCVSANLLKIDDVYRFCGKSEEIDKEFVVKEIESEREFCEDVAKEIGSEGNRLKSLSGDSVLEMICKVVDQVGSKEPYYSLLAWRIIVSEMKRVKSELSYN